MTHNQNDDSKANRVDFNDKQLDFTEISNSTILIIFGQKKVEKKKAKAFFGGENLPLYFPSKFENEIFEYIEYEAYQWGINMDARTRGLC